MESPIIVEPALIVVEIDVCKYVRFCAGIVRDPNPTICTSLKAVPILTKSPTCTPSVYARPIKLVQIPRSAVRVVSRVNVVVPKLVTVNLLNVASVPRVSVTVAIPPIYAS